MCLEGVLLALIVLDKSLADVLKLLNLCFVVQCSHWVMFFSGVQGIVLLWGAGYSFLAIHVYVCSLKV